MGHLDNFSSLCTNAAFQYSHCLELEDILTHGLWSEFCFLRKLGSHSWFLKWFKKTDLQ